ncbi:MAG: class I SAM-dependent methyltransferase [bacterium]
MARRLGVIPTIAASVFVRQTSRLYDYIGTQPGLGHFLNVGWWEKSEDDWQPSSSFSMEKQCQALVRRVARRAGLDRETRLLDVGFGYGEQDRIFLDEFNCGDIVGINITSSQVEKARELVGASSKAGRFHPHVGNAVRLPYPSNSFNTIVALESPFHFNTRQQFFDEAKRVLEPGGRLVTTDIINAKRKTETSVGGQFLEAAHNTYWQVCDENHCTVNQYNQRLRQRGFQDVQVDDVTEQTLIPGITRYIRWRASLQSSWLQWLIAPGVTVGLNFYRSGHLRYVIASASNKG